MHNLETGDTVTFCEVKGMTALNGLTTKVNGQCRTIISSALNIIYCLSSFYRAAVVSWLARRYFNPQVRGTNPGLDRLRIFMV